MELKCWPLAQQTAWCRCTRPCPQGCRVRRWGIHKYLPSHPLSQHSSSVGGCRVLTTGGQLGSRWSDRGWFRREHVSTPSTQVWCSLSCLPCAAGPLPLSGSSGPGSGPLLTLSSPALWDSGYSTDVGTEDKVKGVFGCYPM